MLTLYRSCYADVVTTEQDEGSYDQVKIAMEFSLDNIPKFIARVENFLKLGPDTSSPHPAPHTPRRGACFVWSSACSRSRPREGRHLGCPAEPTVLPPSDHSRLKSAWRCRLGAARVGWGHGPALVHALGQSEGRQVFELDAWLGAELCFSGHADCVTGLLSASGCASAASGPDLCRRPCCVCQAGSLRQC